VRCFTATCENKKFQHGAFLLSTLASLLTELSKVFQTGYFDFAQMKSSVELCINKVYDAAAKSELKANCEKFGSELGELGKRDYLTDSCVSSGMAFWKSAESFSEFTVPIHKRESGVDKPITAASLCFVSQEECQDATKIIEPKLDDTPCSFCRGHSTKEKILLSSKFLRIPGKMPKIYTYALSISGKCMARFLVKIFGGVTGVRC